MKGLLVAVTGRSGVTGLVSLSGRVKRGVIYAVQTRVVMRYGTGQIPNIAIALKTWRGIGLLLVHHYLSSELLLPPSLLLLLRPLRFHPLPSFRMAASGTLKMFPTALSSRCQSASPGTLGLGLASFGGFVPPFAVIECRDARPKRRIDPSAQRHRRDDVGPRQVAILDLIQKQGDFPDGSIRDALQRAQEKINRHPSLKSLGIGTSSKLLPELGTQLQPRLVKQLSARRLSYAP